MACGACEVTTFTVERRPLFVAVASAAVAQCTDDLRAHLAGIHLRASGSTLIASASDGHRLVQTTVPLLEEVSADVTTFLDRADVKQLVKALRCKKAQASEPVTVEIGGVVRVAGTFGTVELVDRGDEPVPVYVRATPPRREATDKGPGLFGLSAKYLGDVGVLGRLLAPPADGVEISVASAREAVRFDLRNRKIGETVYVVMPLRI